MSEAATDAEADTRNRPLRIAHLALGALPATVGGLEIVVDNLIRNQRSLGHEAALITRWQQARAARHAQSGYPVHALPPFRNLSRTPFKAIPPRLPVELGLAWHVLRNRFDILHAHWLFPTAWLAARPARILGTPLVATAHGADMQTHADSAYGYRQFPANEQRLRSAAREVHAAVAISPGLAVRLGEIGVAPGRIHGIPNGVDAARFSSAEASREETRARLNIGTRTTLLLAVGRNQPSKGFEILPQVMALLRDQGRDAACCIVGAGARDLSPEFSSRGLAGHVRLIDAIRPPSGSFLYPPDELISLYGAADLFVFPSLTEGAPLVALEAMAAGVPVIGSDVQGIRDAVAHEVTGLLCPPRDPLAMASAIGRLIDDPSLSDRMRNAGRAAAHLHSWPAIAERHCELYRAVLRRGAT